MRIDATLECWKSMLYWSKPTHIRYKTHTIEAVELFASTCQVLRCPPEAKRASEEVAEGRAGEGWRLRRTFLEISFQFVLHL